MTASGSRRRGEFALIGELFAPLAMGAPAALGLKDDAAVLQPPPGTDVVITTDALTAGVHFLQSDSPADCARKALRVNLSDLAAMGAAPVGVTLALSIPPHWGDAELEDFAAGLGEDLRAFGVPLLGGDTTSTPGPLTLCVTAIGRVPHGQAMLRSGARSGDRVLVSGSIGDGHLGLLALDPANQAWPEGARAALAERYRHPQPRLTLGDSLRGLASACIDVSDGLIADLTHVCEASGVRAIVDPAKLPVSEAARAILALGELTPDALLAGGDDYELLFTVPEMRLEAAMIAAAWTAVAVTEIGVIVAADDPRWPAELPGPVALATAGGGTRAPAARGFVHF